MAKTRIPPKPILSERIKLARSINLPGHKDKKKLTQEDLAELLDVSVQTIRKYESGQFGIPNRSIREIANVLGCSVAYLNGETNAFTEEEYKSEQVELEESVIHAKRYLDKVAAQYRITTEFLTTFLGYGLKETYICKSNHSIEPIIIMTAPDGHTFKFHSRREIEDFLLSFYEDTKKLLQYHLCKREFYGTDHNP